MQSSFINVVAEINSALSAFVWGLPTIFLILGTGLFLSVRTRFLQIRRFGEVLSKTIIPAVKSLGGKRKKDLNGKSISQFEAFSTAISGTVGTGNIVGVVAAILTGGAGAVFWMWVSALFGMAVSYCENVLGLYFRKSDESGNLSSGSFYYIAYGLGSKWLAYFAAAFCALAAIGMGGVQSNKISGTLAQSLSGDSENARLVIGIVVALLAAVIIGGGIKRIGKVTALLAPVMSLLFIALALVSVVMHFYRVPEAFGLIISQAFDFNAVGCGVMGFGIGAALKKGLARGVFSNEAGLGSSVIAHSASELREPVRQGMWGIFEVFFDTFVICTLTALMFLTTNDVSALSPDMDDSVLSVGMFSANFGGFGVLAFSLILPLFAFTSIIAWSYYGEKAVGFLSGKRSKYPVMIFRALFVALIVAAPCIQSGLVWELDDTFNGLMALPNLVSLVALSGLVVRITKNYYARKNGRRIAPMLSAYDKKHTL